MQNCGDIPVGMLNKFAMYLCPHGCIEPLVIIHEFRNNYRKHIRRNMIINNYFRSYFCCFVHMKSILLLCLFIGALGIVFGCGKKTVEERESFHPNGTLWERWYEDSAGFKHGKAQTYYPTGQLQTEGEFLNGYLNGEFVMWSKEGRELSRGMYKDGEPWTGTFVTVDNMQKRVVFNTYHEGELVK